MGFCARHIQCDGRDVTFPGLFQPTAPVGERWTAMVADNLAGPRNMLF